MARGVLGGGGARPIRDIRRRVAVRPIIFFAGEIGTWARCDERRDVEGLLVVERAGPIERHVVPDEACGGTQAAHACADVERLASPERRRDGRALAIGAVTPRALYAEDRA